jgi:hypothetical protein
LSKKDFLDSLYKPFMDALNNSNIRDSANIAGWLGEDFKDAIWTSQINSGQNLAGSFTFDFINVGSNTEKALVELVKDKWGAKINESPFGTGSSKSHSDWVLRNSEGKIVRA